MNEKSTKKRIMDAAEKLFAIHGFDGTSLRAITTEAKVNLASVNYHFQTKEALMDAVMARRLDVVNRKRLEMLDEAERAAGANPLCLERTLEAFYRPALELLRTPEAKYFPMLMSRLITEPALFQRLFESHLVEVERRFRAAIRRALPNLPPADLAWRMLFTIGILTQSLAAQPVLQAVLRGASSPRDVDGTVARMVAFASAGLRAPVHQEVGKCAKA